MQFRLLHQSDHPSQTHLSSSIFCLLGGGGVESVESGSSFSELMKLFGLHPSPLLRIFFWRVANKSSPLPKQHLSHFYIFFYGIFLGGGKVRLGGDELIKLEKILYNSPYLHTCPQPSSTFLLKVGGFNLKCRLTDQIPTLTLRNSPPLPISGEMGLSYVTPLPLPGAPCFLLSVLFIYSVDPAFTP